MACMKQYRIVHTDQYPLNIEFTGVGIFMDTISKVGFDHCEKPLDLLDLYFTRRST